MDCEVIEKIYDILWEEYVKDRTSKDGLFLKSILNLIDDNETILEERENKNV